MDLEDARTQARNVTRYGCEKVKRRQEASAFGEAHGKSHMFVNVIQKSKDPQLSRLILLADWLNVEVEDLLQEAEVASDDIWLQEPRMIPPLVERAYSLLEDAGRIGSRAVRMAPGLQRIDEARYSNPAQAQAQLHQALESLPIEQAPYVLNIAASCCRMLLDLRSGACHARAGGELAKALDNPLAIGDNLQRWVYLHSNGGNRTTALRYNERSTQAFVEGGSRRKLAETLVDHGYCLYYLAEYERAVRAYRTAQEFSDCLSGRHNYAWMQGLATSHLALGAGELARDLALRAVRLAEGGCNELIQGNSLWVLGRIEASLGSSEAAEAHCLRASARLKQHHPLDALLALLEVYTFRQGDRSGVELNLLDRLAEFLPIFRDLPRVRTILQDLLATVHLQRLTRAGVQQVMRDLKACRPQYYRARAA